MTATIRPYAGTDLTSLLACWRAALPLDAVDAGRFTRQVLLDPNFEPRRLLVAAADGGVLGFCLTVARRAPYEDLGVEADRGWITAFGVDPAARRQGLGSRLLAAALASLAAEGRSQVRLADYVPGYFVPGLDVAHYAAGLEFLAGRGFEVVARPLAMAADLARPMAAPAVPAGAEVRPARAEDVPELLALVAAEMPGDWLRMVRERLATLDFESLVVARRDDQMAGWCQFDGEHFGPIGVRPEGRGQGLGRALLGAALSAMRARGLAKAWVLWTGDAAAAKVYGPLGFVETRRFAVLRRWL